MTSVASYSIGEVAAMLGGEFANVTVSKLRFLESEGLIRPERSESGYRSFSATDVEKVRYILRQQRDHFLPLKVIKTKLSAWERGEEPTVSPEAGPPPEAYFSTSNVSMDAEELARTAGIPSGVIDDLVTHGVITPTATPAGDRYNEDDLGVARAAHRLVAHGLEARHLKAIRHAANREVDLFRQLTGPLLRHASPSSRHQAAEVLADVAQAARELQESLVRADLRTLLDR